MIMLRQFITCGLVLTVSLTARADDKPVAKPTNAGFEKLKKLEGTWMVADKNGKATDEVASIVKVTAGGSAIQETQFPGQPHEMLSVYTVDGNDLTMTHYCVLGNQPRMKADPKSPKDQIVWQFTGGGNLDVKKDKHMHEAIVTFIDDDHIGIEGTGWENGAPAKEMCCGMKLVRKK